MKVLTFEEYVAKRNAAAAQNTTQGTATEQGAATESQQRHQDSMNRAGLLTFEQFRRAQQSGESYDDILTGLGFPTRETYLQSLGPTQQQTENAKRSLVAYDQDGKVSAWQTALNLAQDAKAYNRARSLATGDETEETIALRKEREQLIRERDSIYVSAYDIPAAYKRQQLQDRIDEINERLDEWERQKQPQTAEEATALYGEEMVEVPWMSKLLGRPVFNPAKGAKTGADLISLIGNAARMAQGNLTSAEQAELARQQAETGGRLGEAAKSAWEEMRKAPSFFKEKLTSLPEPTGDETVDNWHKDDSANAEAARVIAETYGIPTYALDGSATRENTDAYTKQYEGMEFGEKLGANAGMTAASYGLDITNAALTGWNALSGGRLGEGDGTASSIFRVTNFLQNAGSGLTGQAYASMRESANWLEKLIIDLEKTGVEQVLDRTLGAGNGLVPMGIRVFGSTAQESEDRGEDWKKQAGTGLVRASIELATEMLSGVGGSWRGTGYGESFLNAVDKWVASKTGSELLGTLTRAYGGETIEEMIADVLNPLADRIFGIGEATGRGQDRTFMQQLGDFLTDVWGNGQLLYDGLLGGLAGMGGGAVTQIGYNASARNLGVDVATFKAAQRIASDKKLKATFEQLTGAELAESEETAIIQVAVYLTNIGEINGGLNATQIEDNLINQSAVETADENNITPFTTTETAPQRAPMTAEDYARRVMDAEPDTADIRTEEGRARVQSATANLGDYSDMAARAYDPDQDVGNYAAGMYEAAAIYGAAGADVRAAVQQARDGKIQSAMRVLTDNQVAIAENIGRQMREDTAKAASDVSTAYSAIRQQAAAIGTRAAQNTARISAAVRRANSIGSTAMATFKAQRDALEAMVQANPELEGSEEFNRLFDEAKRNMETVQRMQRAVENLKNKRAKAEEEQRRATEHKAGRVSYETESGNVGGVQYEAVNRAELTQTQQAVGRIAEAIAKATGLEIHVARFGGNVGGEYLRGQGGVIWLNIDANYKGANIAVGSLTHELTHWLQEYAPEEYQQLKRVVLDEMTRDPARFAQVFGDRARVQPDLRPSDITDEMTANACQVLFMDEASVQRIVSENRSLGQKILDFFKSILADIKAAFSEIDTSSDFTLYQEVRAAEGAIDQMRDLFVQAMHTATENLQAERTVQQDSAPKQAEQMTGKNGKTSNTAVSETSGETESGNESSKNTAGKETVFTGESGTAYTQKQLDALSSLSNETLIAGVEASYTMPYNKLGITEEQADALRKAGLLFTETTEEGDTYEYLHDTFLYDERARRRKIDTQKYKQQASESSKNAAPEGGVQNSKPQMQNWDEDSTGKKLTEGQQAFFADSKIRDAEGRLKVMYRGGEGDFTVFDRRKSSYSNLYGRGFYFTDSEAHASQYGKARAFYLNISNPLQEGNKTITRAQLRAYLKAVAEDEDYGLDNYGREASVESVLRGLWGKDDFGIIGDVNATCIGDMVAATELFNTVNGTAFDGIVVPTETVAFRPEQIKSTDNKNPTNDKDIQLQMWDEDEYSAVVGNRTTSELLDALTAERESQRDLQRQLRDRNDEYQERLRKALHGSDDELAAFSAWAEESGYNALYEQEKEAYRRVHILNDAYDKARDAEMEAEERQAIEKSGLSEAEYFGKQAVKTFGYTPYFYDAGYIVPNGKMLNFSGEKGRHFGSRGEDHRAIGQIFANTQMTEAMVRFMGYGNIRIMAESPGIDIINSEEPTAEQYKTIRDFIRNVADEEYFNVDLTDGRGNTIGSLEYDGTIRPDRVVNDIKHYFQTGEIRDTGFGAFYQRWDDTTDDTEEEKAGRDLAYARIQSENAVLTETVAALRKLTAKQDNTIEKLQKRLQLTKTPEVRESDARKLARQLIAEHSSRADLAEVTAQIKALGDYLLQTNTQDVSEDELKNRARQIAAGIIDAVTEDINLDSERYQQIAGDIKGKKLSIDEDFLGELDAAGGYETFRKSLFGSLTLAKRDSNTAETREDYTSVSQFYADMQSTYGKGSFPDVANEGEEVQILAQMLDAGKPTEVNPYEKYRGEATEELSNRIVMDALNGVLRPTPPTDADRQKSRRVALQQQIKALKAENKLSEREAGRLYATIYDLSVALDKAESRYTTLRKEADIRAAKVYQEGLARAAEIKASERARAAGQIKDLKEHYKEIAQRAKDRREESAGIKKYRKQVDKKAKALYELLMTNSNDKHVPQALKIPLGEFLESLDFSSKRSLAGGDQTQADLKLAARMQRVQQMLENQQRYINGDSSVKDDFGGYIDVSPDMLEYLREMSERITETMNAGRTFTINQMSAEELRGLSNLLSNLTQSIKNMNQFMANARYASVQEAASKDVEFMVKLGKVSKAGNSSASRFLLWENGVPYYLFKRFGSGGVAIFDGFTKGWEKMAFNAQEIIKFTEEAYTDKEVRQWKQESHDFTLEDGQQIHMTTGQVMELSQLLGRDQAVRHIERGGIRIGNIDSKTGQIVDTNHYHLTDNDISMILGSLSARQLEVAKKMQSYMAKRGAEWGNEISMRRFGYNFYEEGDNYYPIRTDSNDRALSDTDAQQNSMFRLLNLSSSKALNPKASNALIVGDIFDTFSDHMSDMAKLNGMGLPILDAIKWFNYKERIDRGDGTYDTVTLQGAMEEAYGGQAQHYFRTLMKDINGLTETGDRGTGLAGKFLGNYKAAAVGANLRVAMLQPTSYLRALTVIKPQYLAAAFGAKNGYQEAMKYSGTAVWKSLGYYDTDISKGMRGQIQHDDTIKDKIVEKSMVLAELGDKLTWGRLWNACKMQTKAENRSLSGEALNQKTADLFRAVIYSSQVMDATLTRSEIMRGKGVYSKMSSAFMAEPTLSYNILLDAASDYDIDRRRFGAEEARKRNLPKIGRAFIVYAASATFSAVIESLADAARDDDDESFWDKFLEAFLGDEKKLSLSGNLMQDLTIIGKIPYLKNLASLVQGYKSGDMSISAFSSVADAYNIWKETYLLSTGALEKATKVTYYGKMTEWGKIYKTLQALSQLSGIPAANMTRDVFAIWNTIVNGTHNEWKIETYDNTKDRNLQRLIKATESGDAAAVSEAVTAYGDEKTALSALKTALKESVTGGERTAADASEMLVKAGMTKNDAFFLVQGWETGDSGKYTAVKRAAFADDASAFRQAMGDLTAHGVKQKDAQGYVKTFIRSVYLGGELGEEEQEIVGDKTLTAVQARKLLHSYAGLSVDEAVSTVSEWDDIKKLERQHGAEFQAYGLTTPQARYYYDTAKGKVSISEYSKQVDSYGLDAVKRYYNDEGWRDTGLTMEQYAKYAEQAAKCKGTDKNGDGKADRGTQQAQIVEVINSLNVSQDVKDAIYLKQGYSKSKLRSMPWH